MIKVVNVIYKTRQKHGVVITVDSSLIKEEWRIKIVDLLLKQL